LLKLWQYELDNDDWVILEDLLHVLKVFIRVLNESSTLTRLLQIYKEATLFFSGDTQTMIVHVIPTMDHIDTSLKHSNHQPLSPSVKQALKFARAIINKYYSKTDLSNMYRIVMGECRAYSRFGPCAMAQPTVYFAWVCWASQVGPYGKI
jgi:hypothetical protein